MKLRWVTSLCCLALLPAVLAADAWKLPAETAKFKPGSGAPLAIANCTICHSADYISTQPPLSRQAWRVTVEKMRLKYGAPIATNNVDTIVEYLVTSYKAVSSNK